MTEWLLISGSEMQMLSFSIFYRGVVVHNVDKNGDTDIQGKIKVGSSGIALSNLTGGTVVVGPDNGPNDALDVITAATPHTPNVK